MRISILLSCLLVIDLVLSLDCVVERKKNVKSTSGFPSLKRIDCSEPEGFASGTFVDTISSNGWSRLEIQTNGSANDKNQAYAAGYLEGSLTVQRIFEFYTNMNMAQTIPPAIQNYVETNKKWLLNQMDRNEQEPYWHQVKLMYHQVVGLYNGYTDNAPIEKQFPFSVFYIAQFSAEMEDLCSAYGGCSNSLQDILGTSHCSVLIKLLPGFSDVITGHTTWAGYQSMTRIYKKYDFSYNRFGELPGKVITFSSYPGTIYSVDDFYQISSGLVVTETTIENHNNTLWNNVQPTNQVPNWFRCMIANTFAIDGKSWMGIYQRYNSGTYNNQWMVVDYKLFKPKQGVQDGFLWVGEQLPGFFHHEDMTAYFTKYLYWISFNRPFFPFTIEMSDQQKMIDKYGDHYSWEKTARSVIFRANQNKVVDEESYQNLIRANNYRTDSIATQGCTGGRSASNAISERGDLTNSNANCIPDIAQQNEGGIDAKYTTYAKTMSNNKLSTTIQSGPTHVSSVPPFVWSKSPFSSISHLGQPDVFVFPWINISFSL